MAEIPNEAKKCQHCGSKQKGKIGFIRGTLVVLLALVFLPVIISSLAGFGDSNTSISEQDKKLAVLVKKNKELRNKKIIDEFTSNRQTIITKIVDMSKKGNKIEASKEAKKFIRAGVKDSELIALSTKLEKEIQKKRAAEKAEKTRLANLNKTGIWTNSFYVDDFGEPTNKPYITNSQYVSGFFSNTATQDSKLNVKFLISGRSDISIQLYEYARKNPVKSYGDSINHNYSVLIKDKDGKKYKLSAKNWTERLSFGKAHAKRLHKILMKGGMVSFRIINTDTGSDQYGFEINATYYDHAYRKLKEAYRRKS